MFKVRPAGPDDDFEAIGNVYVKSWQAGYKGIVPQDYLDSLSSSRWAPKLSSGMHEILMLMDGGVYAGAASLCPARDEAMAGWGEIVSMYVLPEYFGRGAGQMLMEAALARLKAKGFDRIYLWVLQENRRARRFYEKHCFELSADSAEISVGGKTLTEVRYIQGAGDIHPAHMAQIVKTEIERRVYLFDRVIQRNNVRGCFMCR